VNKTYSPLDPYSNIAPSLRDLYRDLDKGESVPPLAFLTTLRTAFPQFAERTNMGYMQQDAEECWSRIIESLLPVGSEGLDKGFVEKYMTGEKKSIIKCAEAPDEEPIIEMEKFSSLPVNISGGGTYWVFLSVFFFFFFFV